MLLEQFIRDFKNQIEKVNDVLIEQFRKKLKAQGHFNTGKLSDSIYDEIDIIGTTIVSSFYYEDYGTFIDKGIAANRIPYRRGSGAGSSKYIEGLISFFKSKGLSDRISSRAAFATANVQKREGMPTRGSYAYSNDGTRTGFVNAVIFENSTLLDSLFDDAVAATFEVIFTDMIEKFQATLN
jgi:hypothetical protein